MAITPNQKLVQYTFFTLDPLQAIYAIRLLESASNPETQATSISAASGPGLFCSFVDRADASVFLVAPCSQNLAAVGRSIFAVCTNCLVSYRVRQPVGALPFSSVGLCLLSFRLRLWLRAWGIGLHHSTAWAAPNVYQVVPCDRGPAAG